MSDTGEDPSTTGRRLLHKSQTRPLRERLGSHLADHAPPTDLKTLRSELSAEGGDSLAELVDEGRDERV
jgi:hypothetical protein